ncbi:hypothetical protein [Conexibacter sp. CPCC 206217]|uniref:hypothetical protein n=1 Tax=Conexibacter sp. CPCC 206217 TaxID=3064574 RepID=UPI00271EA03F|nr:hypothetical protein [Conexibacter sp. CPCC 206217]MDO8214029.1 hypothetical protein [Conexibacter sp. CPCC 206217]
MPADARESSQPAAAGTSVGSTGGLLRWLVSLAAIVLVALLAGCGGGGEDGGDDTATAPRRAPAVAASLDRLASVATDAGHPVFWAGPRDGMTYELTQTRDGRTFVRYLPQGVAVGAPAADYLAIATYPQRDALATLLATARRQGVEAVATSGGGRAFQDADRPTSAYLAVPGADVQVEIFDPAPGRALRLATSGQVVPVSAARAAGAVPRAATVAQLGALPAAVGHAVYWAGAEDGATYELTRTGDGRVYVRYLPQGVEVDTDDPDYLTIGTYPTADAVATLRKAAAAAHAQTFDAAAGGIAYADPKHPGSVYVAYPGADVQVEVYDPDGARARALVTSGRLAALG